MNETPPPTVVQAVAEGMRAIEAMTDHVRDLFAWAITQGPIETDVDDARVAFDAWLAEDRRQAAEGAWSEGYDEGVQRGIGLGLTGHLVTRRLELGPIPTSPYARAAEGGGSE